MPAGQHAEATSGCCGSFLDRMKQIAGVEKGLVDRGLATVESAVLVGLTPAIAEVKALADAGRGPALLPAVVHNVECAVDMVLRLKPLLRGHHAGRRHCGSPAAHGQRHDGGCGVVGGGLQHGGGHARPGLLDNGPAGAQQRARRCGAVRAVRPACVAAEGPCAGGACARRFDAALGRVLHHRRRGSDTGSTSTRGGSSAAAAAIAVLPLYRRHHVQ